jgi:hypothetical protein
MCKIVLTILSGFMIFCEYVSVPAQFSRHTWTRCPLPESQNGPEPIWSRRMTWNSTMVAKAGVNLNHSGNHNWQTVLFINCIANESMAMRWTRYVACLRNIRNAEWLALLLHIREVPVWDLGPNTRYPERPLVIALILSGKCLDTILN